MGIVKLKIYNIQEEKIYIVSERRFDSLQEAHGVFIDKIKILSRSAVKVSGSMIASLMLAQRDGLAIFFFEYFQ